jgi:hypothetical protein
VASVTLGQTALEMPGHRPRRHHDRLGGKSEGARSGASAIALVETGVAGPIDGKGSDFMPPTRAMTIPPLESVTEATVRIRRAEGRTIR